MRIFLSILVTLLACTARAEFRTTGFYHLEKLKNRWCWVDPEGKHFVPIGISLVGMQPEQWNGVDREGNSHLDYCLKRYGSEEGWQKATAARFRDWGLTYTGVFSLNQLDSEGIPYVTTLRLTQYALDKRYVVVGNLWNDLGKNYKLPDLFNPAIEAFAASRAKAIIVKPTDSNLLLHYPDEPDDLKGFNDYHDHLGLAVLLGKKEIGYSQNSEEGERRFPNFTKQTFIERLKDKYRSIEALNKAWGTAFADFDALWTLEYDPKLWGAWKDPRRNGFPAYREDLDEVISMLGERYCRLVKKVIRDIDPNHMIAFQLYGKTLSKPLLKGINRAGGFDVYMTEAKGDAYDTLLKRPVMRLVYLHANADSPQRFEGDIEAWRITRDPEGKISDPNGRYLKCYDDEADIWFELKFAGWRLPARIEGVNLSRDGITQAGEGQVLYSGKEADRSWFTIRATDPYQAGSVKEWAEALKALKQKGEKAIYRRSTTMPQWDFKTQADRGVFWGETVEELVSEVSPQGDHYVVGVEQWKWMDNAWTYWVEQVNFGLVSLKDNAYDGKEATRAGADGKLGTWDDEAEDYGDFITPMKEANHRVIEALKKLGNDQ